MSSAFECNPTSQERQKQGPIPLRREATPGDYGDVVGYDDYEVSANAESPQEYNSNGSRYYFPIRIGDELMENYLIQHKLGHGGFSTVWMAYDKKGGRNVALKIMMSGAEGHMDGQTELTILKDIVDSTRNVKDASSLLTYLDSFPLPSDPSTDFAHLVLVFPLRGPSLRSWMKSQESRPMHLRMTAAWKLLKALKFLHDCGFVHGDVNNSNAMWGINNEMIDSSTTAIKYELIGRPQKHILSGPQDEEEQGPESKTPTNPTEADGSFAAHENNSDSEPEEVQFSDDEDEDIPETWRPDGGEIVKPMHVPERLLQKEIYLGDFGKTFKVGTPALDTVQSPSDTVQSPPLYCAPERFHKQKPSFASDMWSYMVIFTQLSIDLPPFQGANSQTLLTDLVRRLGPLPEDWKGTHRGFTTKERCDDSLYDPSRKIVPEMTHGAIMERLVKEGIISRIHGDLALSVMSRGFCYLPKCRATAKELLEDPSFLAMMRLYKVDMS